MADLPRRKLNIERAADRAPRHHNRILIDERRREAIRLRVAGVDVLAIGQKLAADPEINSSGVGWPGGYGAENYAAGKPPLSDRALRLAVRNDLSVIHKQNSALTAEAAQDLFDLEMQRLDAVVMAMWSKMMSGSERHAGRIIEVSERRSKMLGWDKSPVAAVTVNSSSLAVNFAAPKPEATPEYVWAMYEAMVESAIQPPEVLEAIRATLPPKPGEQAAIDVTAVDTPPDE